MGSQTWIRGSGKSTSVMWKHGSGIDGSYASCHHVAKDLDHNGTVDAITSDGTTVLTHQRYKRLLDGKPSHLRRDVADEWEIDRAQRAYDRGTSTAMRLYKDFVEALNRGETSLQYGKHSWQFFYTFRDHDGKEQRVKIEDGDWGEREKFTQYAMALKFGVDAQGLDGENDVIITDPELLKPISNKLDSSFAQSELLEKVVQGRAFTEQFEEFQRLLQDGRPFGSRGWHGTSGSANEPFLKYGMSFRINFFGIKQRFDLSNEVFFKKVRSGRVEEIEFQLTPPSGKIRYSFKVDSSQLAPIQDEIDALYAKLSNRDEDF